MTDTFPIDWTEWRGQWGQWMGQHAAKFHQPSLRAPGKNFLADDILGTWEIHYVDQSGRAVELSEVTMPDFSKSYGADRIRFVGVTWVDGNGETEAGGVVSSFAELEEVLGLNQAVARGEWRKRQATA